MICITKVACPGPITRLPLELYRAILQYLKRDELIPLLSSARLLRLETLPLYFRAMILEEGNNEHIPDSRVTQFAEMCQAYAGPFVRVILFRNFSIYDHALMQILRAVNNLTDLHISYNASRLSMDLTRFLPRNPSFQLSTLTISHRLDNDLYQFIYSQRMSLRSLSINPALLEWAADDCSFDFEMPALRLLATSTTEIRQPLASSTNLRCMGLCMSWGNLEFVAPSVRALHGLHVLQWPSDLALAFPNLVYLAFSVDPVLFDRVLDAVPDLANLSKLKVGVSLESLLPSQGEFNEKQSIIETLFGRLKQLNTVEVLTTNALWLFTPKHSCIRAISRDDHMGEEWMRYQRDSYQPGFSSGED